MLNAAHLFHQSIFIFQNTPQAHLCSHPTLAQVYKLYGSRNLVLTFTTVYRKGTVMKDSSNASLPPCAAFIYSGTSLDECFHYEQIGSRTNFPNKKHLRWRMVSWVMNTQASNNGWWQAGSIGGRASVAVLLLLSTHPCSNSLCLLLNFIVFCGVFFNILLNKTPWDQRRINQQSSGVQEQINPFYIVSYGKNSFGLWTFQMMNGFQERIKFVNRGSSVHPWYTRLTSVIIIMDVSLTIF
jgi:hypothetical protein